MTVKIDWLVCYLFCHLIHSLTLLEYCDEVVIWRTNLFHRLRVVSVVVVCYMSRFTVDVFPHITWLPHKRGVVGDWRIARCFWVSHVFAWWRVNSARTDEGSVPKQPSTTNVSEPSTAVSAAQTSNWQRVDWCCCYTVTSFFLTTSRQSSQQGSFIIYIMCEWNHRIMNVTTVWVKKNIPPPSEGSWHFSFFTNGCFNRFFTHLLYVLIYARLQIFIQLSPILTKLCHINCNYPVHIICSKCPQSAETHALTHLRKSLIAWLIVVCGK